MKKLLLLILVIFACKSQNKGTQTPDTTKTKTGVAITSDGKLGAKVAPGTAIDLETGDLTQGF